jgi:hypothetical protein
MVVVLAVVLVLVLVVVVVVVVVLAKAQLFKDPPLSTRFILCQAINIAIRAQTLMFSWISFTWTYYRRLVILPFLSSISFKPLFGFWLSQPDHSKPSHSAAVLSN